LVVSGQIARRATAFPFPVTQRGWFARGLPNYRSRPIGIFRRRRLTFLFCIVNNNGALPLRQSGLRTGLRKRRQILTNPFLQIRAS